MAVVRGWRHWWLWMYAALFVVTIFTAAPPFGFGLSFPLPFAVALPFVVVYALSEHSHAWVRLPVYVLSVGAMLTRASAYVFTQRDLGLVPTANWVVLAAMFTWAWARCEEHHGG